MSRFTWALLVGFSVGVFAACSVRFSDEVRYSCKSDSDCGGDGYRCTAPAGGAGACCKATGDEVCGDHLDNDCDGLVDGADSWPIESCNGADDNCNGTIDEGFNLQVDPEHCGRCDRACSAGDTCSQGQCVKRAETDCGDTVDNDQNGTTDCADPSCNLGLCGAGCQCQALSKVERNCVDALDNDGDQKIDCADESCAGAGCGDGGCFCDHLAKRESGCADQRDNDDDHAVDCADSDCAGQLCKSTGSFRCTGTQCLCNGGATVDEDATKCRDGIDNDCDGLIDCQEASCDQRSCNPDGGAGCTCTAGGKTETTCGDRLDNDLDGTTDCADVSDCPAGTACTFLNPQGKVVNGHCTSGLCQ